MQKEAQKVLHIPRRFTTKAWGGTENVVINFCKQQQNEGLEPEIHTSKALDSKKYELYQNIPIHRYNYNYPLFGLSPQDKLSLDQKGGNLYSFPLFTELLRAQNVRLYHAHVTKRLGGMVLTASRWKNKPFVVTLHGNVFDVPLSEKSDVGQAQSHYFDWGKPLGWLFSSRRVLGVADAVICVGHSEYEKAKQSLYHDRVYYLPNGVNPECFAGGNRQRWREEMGLSESDFLFGCISRIDAQKNQKLLIQSFAKVFQKNPQAALCIAGPVTNKTYLEELKKLAQESGVAQRVHFLGAQEPESESLKDLYAALDCFVLPSQHEPFGMVVLEAWAASLPVIASDVGGLQKLVDHECDGLKFSSGEQDQLAQQMTQMAASKELCQSIAATGHSKMLEQYTWKSVYQKLEEIYLSAEELYR